MDPGLTGLGDVLSGTLLVAIGSTALLLALIRRRGIDLLLLSFGLFAALYGVRQIFGSELAPALGISPAVSAWVTSLITYLIQIPAWSFFWFLLGDGWHSLVLWCLRIMTAFACIGVVSDLVQRTPGTLSGAPNNVLVLAGMIAAAVTIWNQRDHLARELRLLIIGLGVFGLFVINDNLVGLGLLPWNRQEESLGFIFFILCLGIVAARRSFASEHKLAAVEGELEAARRIQESILPARLPTLEGASVAVRFQPTSAVAGDFYDFITVTDTSLGVIVADVSGHGVPAALIASMVKVAVASARSAADHPAQLLTEVNRALCGSFQHGFVTAAYAYFDAAAGALRVTSAGHPPPLLRRGSDGRVKACGAGGPILGRFRQARFDEAEIAMAPGDRLLLYTDGLVEARRSDAEAFGDDRLIEFLSGDLPTSPEACLDRLTMSLDEWKAGFSDPRTDDDLTCVMVAIHDSDEPAQNKGSGRD